MLQRSNLKIKISHNHQLNQPANRDPMLFKTFISKIKAAEKSVPDAPKVTIPTPSKKAESKDSKDESDK